MSAAFGSVLGEGFSVGFDVAGSGCVVVVFDPFGAVDDVFGDEGGYDEAPD